MKLLFIGYGAIATWSAEQVRQIDGVSIEYVLCRHGHERKAADRLNIDLCRVFSSVERLLAQPVKIDLAIEVAGQEALCQHGEALLKAGIDLGIASVGALSDQDLYQSLQSAAEAGNCNLILMSGAIGAIDALEAAREGGLDSVTYCGRKPPLSWCGTPAEEQVDLKTLTQPFVHFKGSAREAARLYPKNANVAATVALAGIGLDKTQVELIADPNIDRNIHHIETTGAFGHLHFGIEGLSLPNNPKSSALTAMSVVSTVRRRLGRVNFS